MVDFQTLVRRGSSFLVVHFLNKPKEVVLAVHPPNKLPEVTLISLNGEQTFKIFRHVLDVLKQAR